MSGKKHSNRYASQVHENEMIMVTDQSFAPTEKALNLDDEFKLHSLSKDSALTINFEDY